MGCIFCGRWVVLTVVDGLYLLWWMGCIYCGGGVVFTVVDGLKVKGIFI